MEGKIRKNEKSRESLTCFSFIFSVGWTSVGARLNAGVGLCCWAGSGAPSALCLADDALTSVDDDIVTSQLQSSWRHSHWGVVTSQSQVVWRPNHEVGTKPPIWRREWPSIERITLLTVHIWGMISHWVMLQIRRDGTLKKINLGTKIRKVQIFNRTFQNMNLESN